MKLPEGSYKFALTAGAGGEKKMDLHFKVEAGYIISSEFADNKGTAINGIVQNGKALFKMQFNHNKTIEATFEGHLETPAHIKGTYKIQKVQDAEIESGGQLKLTLVSGKILHDTDLIGKMDPYVIFEHKGTKDKSKVH